MSGRDLSVLGQLAKRAEQIRDAAVLELAVPRWSDPEIVVRYNPVPHRQIMLIADRLEKVSADKRADAAVDLNADILIKACVAVCARFPGDPADYSLRPDDPEGSLTRFDPDLARNLDLGDEATARQVVRALFVTDGDILSAARALTTWSGYQEQEAAEAIAGE